MAHDSYPRNSKIDTIAMNRHLRVDIFLILDADLILTSMSVSSSSELVMKDPRYLDDSVWYIRFPRWKILVDIYSNTLCLSMNTEFHTNFWTEICLFLGWCLVLHRLSIQIQLRFNIFGFKHSVLIVCWWYTVIRLFFIATYGIIQISRIIHNKLSRRRYRHWRKN